MANCMAFLFRIKLKDASRSCGLPEAIFIEKNGTIISVVVIQCTVVIGTRLKFARRIGLELD